MSNSMPSEVMYGSIPVSTRTEIGKHIWSHERKADYRPENNPYPRMMYRAYKGEDGVVRCMDAEPKPWLYANQEMYRMACEQVAQFNLSCQKTVGVIPENGPAEERAAQEEGWRTTPQAAMESVFALQRAITTAAAERSYRDRNISEKARAEVAAAEAETPDQLPEIKQKPIKKHWKTLQKEAKEAQSGKGA